MTNMYLFTNAKSLKLSLLTFVFLLLTTFPVFSQLFIEAEDYTQMNGVQFEGTSDDGGGLNLGWIDTNDWMEYAVEIPIDGDFQLSLRAAGETGGQLKVIVDGTEMQTITIPSTGGWQAWETFSGETTLSLSKGQHTLKLLAAPGGYNLNWLKIKLASPLDTDVPSTPVIAESKASVHDVYLKWNASSDATSSVTGYQILKDGKFYRYSVDTFLNISKLPHNQSFTLSLIANDLTGNASEVSTISVTTDTLPWEITWRDEFDYTGDVDRTKWNFQTGGDGWGNGEAQYYTDGANASVANGVLTIEARQEDFGSNKFTSTRMNSSGKGDFLYGRIEVRAKLPKTGGTWPAIWTLPTEWVYGGWPDCGEIDIMEHSATYGYGDVFGTIHTGAYNHVDGTQQSGGTTYADVTDTFHTYAMEWYPDHIDWYYDDVIVFTFENEYKTTAEWPFDVKHHLLLNMAIGGGLGGTINFGGEWPQQMIVDYARVYDFKLGENDTIAPEEPQNFVADVDWSSVKLSWSPAKDNHAIDKYYVFVDNEKIDSIVGVSYVVRDLEPLTEYTLGVQAIDLSGNLSSQVSTTVSTTEITGIEVPGRIQAEDYTNMYGIDTQASEDGGLNVGWIDASDWLTYTIDVKEDIEFRAVFRVAGEGASSSVKLIDESGAEITTFDFSVSGGWQEWKSVVSAPFTLPMGIQTIKLSIIKGGFNLNWIEIKDKNDIVGISNINAETVSVFPNPTNGNLHVSSPNADISCVEILDVTGRILKTNYYNSTLNQISIELTGAAIKPGILMVRIHSNHAVFIEKVVYTK